MSFAAVGLSPIKTPKGQVKVTNPVVDSNLVGRTLFLRTNAGRETVVLPGPFSRKLLGKHARAGKKLPRVNVVPETMPPAGVKAPPRFKAQPSMSDTKGCKSLGYAKPLPETATTKVPDQKIAFVVMVALLSIAQAKDVFMAYIGR